MEEIFQEPGWRTEEILKGLEDAEDFYCESLAVVKWSLGPMSAWFLSETPLTSLHQAQVWALPAALFTPTYWLVRLEDTAKEPRPRSVFQ